MTEHQELVSIFMMGLGVILWSLGGWRWKGWRRIVLPVVMIGLVLWYGVAWWQAVLSSGLLYLAACMPYGTNTPWFIPNRHGSKMAAGISYIFPALVYGWTWWFIITPVLFMLIFWASNSKALHKDFIWKVCEGWIGLMVVVTIIAAILRPWGG